MAPVRTGVNKLQLVKTYSAPLAEVRGKLRFSMTSTLRECLFGFFYRGCF